MSIEILKEAIIDEDIIVIEQIFSSDICNIELLEENRIICMKSNIYSIVFKGIELAVLYNKKSILDWILSFKKSSNKIILESVAVSCVVKEDKYEDMLKYVMDKSIELNIKLNLISCCKMAALYGSINVLKKLHQLGMSIIDDDIISNAIRGENIDILEWIEKITKIDMKVEMINKIKKIPIPIKVLKWYENKYNIIKDISVSNVSTIIKIFENCKTIETIQYIVNISIEREYFTRQFTKDKIYEYSLMSGYMNDIPEVLEWIEMMNYKVYEKYIRLNYIKLAQYNSIECIKYIGYETLLKYSNIIIFYTISTSIEIFEYLYENIEYEYRGEFLEEIIRYMNSIESCNIILFDWILCKEEYMYMNNTIEEIFNDMDILSVLCGKLSSKEKEKLQSIITK